MHLVCLQKFAQELFSISPGCNNCLTLGTRGFSCVGREFSVLAEEKTETGALEKSLAPRVQLSPKKARTILLFFCFSLLLLFFFLGWWWWGGGMVNK